MQMGLDVTSDSADDRLGWEIYIHLAEVHDLDGLTYLEACYCRSTRV